MLLFSCLLVLTQRLHSAAQVVHFAKHTLGLPVVTDMAIEAEHAYLPKYGLEWHSEPMSIWTNWLAPYRCGGLISERPRCFLPRFL